jgi:hypothetical protein
MTGKIVPLTLREANDFVELHHRHSSRTSNDGGKFAIGLEVDGRLIGVAIVGRPISRELQQAMNGDGTAELLRCCTGPDAFKGAESKLYARCKRIWQLMGGTRLVTYTLARESGASLRGAGMRPMAEVRGRQWNGSKRAGRVVADEPKIRWEDDLKELPL